MYGHVCVNQRLQQVEKETKLKILFWKKIHFLLLLFLFLKSTCVLNEMQRLNILQAYAGVIERGS